MTILNLTCICNVSKQFQHSSLGECCVIWCLRRYGLYKGFCWLELFGRDILYPCQVTFEEKYTTLLNLISVHKIVAQLVLNWFEDFQFGEPKWKEIVPQVVLNLVSEAEAHYKD